MGLVLVEELLLDLVGLDWGCGWGIFVGTGMKKKAIAARAKLDIPTAVGNACLATIWLEVTNRFEIGDSRGDISGNVWLSAKN